MERQNVTIKRASSGGRMLWLESAAGGDLMEPVERVGAWKTGRFGHAMYRTLGVEGKIFEVAYDLEIPGEKWISRTFQEVK